jgi:hypothetical protein
MKNEDGSVGPEGSTSAKGGERVATHAHDAAERLKSSAHEQIEAAKERAETGREHAAERIRRVGNALRGVASELREHDDAFVAKYADAVSDSIDRVATYVGELEPASLAGDATRFARNKPAWFFGGAFLVGLAAGRFFKSSRPELGDTSLDRPRLPEGEHRGPGRSYARAGSFGTSEAIETRGVFDTEERLNP